jgi:hypothetical protein
MQVLFALHFTAALNILHRTVPFLPTLEFYKEKKKSTNLHLSILYVNHISFSTAKTKEGSEYNQSRVFCITKKPNAPYGLKTRIK